MFKAYEFALLVAVCFLLICWVLTSDLCGVRSKLSAYLPVMDPSHEYHMLYKGALVALATLAALGLSEGRVVMQQSVGVSA
jgi:hypothetical protein